MNAYIKFNKEFGYSEFVSHTKAKKLTDERARSLPEGCELIKNVDAYSCFFIRKDGGISDVSESEWREYRNICRDIQLLKNETIKKLKDSCQDFIFTRFPYYKQLNLIRENKKDFKRMECWIDSARVRCQQYEKQINEMTDPKEVLDFIPKW